MVTYIPWRAHKVQGNLWARNSGSVSICTQGARARKCSKYLALSRLAGSAEGSANERLQEARGALEREMRRAKKASNHRALSAIALVVTERVEWAGKPRSRLRRVYRRGTFGSPRGVPTLDRPARTVHQTVYQSAFSAAALPRPVHPADERVFGLKNHKKETRQGKTPPPPGGQAGSSRSGLRPGPPGSPGSVVIERDVA